MIIGFIRFLIILPLVLMLFYISTVNRVEIDFFYLPSFDAIKIPLSYVNGGTFIAGFITAWLVMLLNRIETGMKKHNDK